MAKASHTDGWSMKQISRPKSLNLLVAEQIRELIVSGVIELGALISENDVANKLNVSRTPVREALQKLEIERLVQIIPQRGTFVFQFNEQELEQTCKMREILEVGALSICLQKDRRGLLVALDGKLEQGEAALKSDSRAFHEADAAFHTTLVETSKNQDLIDAYHNIINRIRSLLNRLARTPAELSGSHQDHMKLVELIRNGEDSEAKAMLGWHVNGLLRMYQNKEGARQP
ncbi:hypothetical protein BTJ39_21195 [Izhakiella australiensis]|uniref:HTH gntR-type domain-containing protein n=1 Tax=Izhakiella australiensis TaxID=1926881 RepID=A0A1S8YDF5_9GAMM|nr:GntR family transcriptional regulator [Izhakiella australiensis]OON36995.1 hypothetical protein BTJ39_21195 [Izhakiella australiensis]